MYDPWADAERVKKEYGITTVDRHAEGVKYDAVILAVSHKEFADIDYRNLVVDDGVIYDVKGVLPRDIVDARL